MLDFSQDKKVTREYSTSGRLHYSSSGWLWLQLNLDLQRYYQYWIEKLERVKVNRPKFGCHITGIAGKYESVQNSPLWNKYEGEIVPLIYYVPWQEIEGVYWLVCSIPRLTQIRNEFGLSDTPKWPFHITIANKKNISA
jgi:hypothetical protein